MNSTGENFWKGDYFKIYDNSQQKGSELHSEKFRKEPFKHDEFKKYTANEFQRQIGSYN